MKKRLFGMLLALTMVLSLCLAMGITAGATEGAVASVGDIEYTTISDAVNAWVDGTTLKLLSNITLTSTIDVSGKDTAALTLDLNGYMLTGNISTIIKAADTGSFTITDSNPQKVHYYQYSASAAWTYYGDEAPASGNVAESVDAVNANTNYVKVTGGCISGATSWAFHHTSYGDDKQTFTMTGGNVVGNKLGVYNNGNTYIGGTAKLIGNETNSIYHRNDSYVLQIGGSAQVSPLSLGCNNGSRAKVTVVSPDSSMKISVKIEDSTSQETDGSYIITTPGSADYSKYFTIASPNNIDTATYAVANTGSASSQVVKIGQYAAVLIKQDGTNTAYAKIQVAVNKADASGSTVKMIKNSQENVTVSSGKSVTLDLNGYALKANNSGTNTIDVKGGTLTLTDNGTSGRTNYFTYVEKGMWVYIESPTQTQIDNAVALANMENATLTSGSTVIAIPGGVITGGKFHAIRVCLGGTLYFNGGTIAGNTGSWGVSLELNYDSSNYSLGGGKCTMDGGNIIGNYTSVSGEAAANVDNSSSLTLKSGLIAYNSFTGSNDFNGALRINNSSTFIMTGGTISHNYSSKTAGGVAVLNNSTATITGGNIVNNSSVGVGAGISVESSAGTVTLGGTANITGNKNTNGNDNNLYLASGKTVAISTTTAPVTGTGGMKVGVTTATKPSDTVTVDFTGSNSADYSGCFFLDDSKYALKEKDTSSHALQIDGEPVCKITQSDNTALVGIGYSTIAKALNAAGSDKTTIQLISDVNENVNITGGKDITLDLNGYVLKGTANKPVISIDNDNTLTVTDSNTGNRKHNFIVNESGLWTLTDQTANAKALDKLEARPKTGDIITVTGGCITGGNNTSSGGGAVENYGTFNFRSGNIVGNTVETNNGGGVWSRYIANIEGGNIMGNLSTGTTVDGVAGGGGIYSDGTLTISGGNVLYNTSLSNGGGVCNNEGTLKLYGGKISGNVAAAKGAGVFHHTTQIDGYPVSGSVTIGGTAVVSDNALSDGTTSNLHIYDENFATYNECSVKIGTGESDSVPVPATGMNVGITLGIGEGTGRFTANGAAADIQYFFGDNEEYVVKYNTDHLELVFPPEYLKATMKGVRYNADDAYYYAFNGDIFSVDITVEGAAFAGAEYYVEYNPETVQLMSYNSATNTYTEIEPAAAADVKTLTVQEKLPDGFEFRTIETISGTDYVRLSANVVLADKNKDGVVNGQLPAGTKVGTLYFKAKSDKVSFTDGTINIGGKIALTAKEAAVSVNASNCRTKVDELIVAPLFDIELVSDYVSGKTLAVLYTESTDARFAIDKSFLLGVEDNDTVKYTYGRTEEQLTALAEADRQYLNSGDATNAQTYVYAIVADVNSADWSISEIYDRISFDNISQTTGRTYPTAVSFKGDAQYNVNGSVKTDLYDAVSAAGVYNVIEEMFATADNMSNYMRIILKADVNRDGIVNMEDVTKILNNYTK